MATPTDSIDLQGIHDFLVEVALKAGNMIVNAKPQVGTADLKKNSVDLVTQTDKAVEDMVSASLRANYPSYEFLGEETYSPERPLTEAPTFIVDPIDGTTNFVHGFPCVCISLGFAVARCPKVGVIYSPYLKTLYTAIEGKGAYLNRDTKLPLKGDQTEPLSGLSHALVGIEYGSDRTGQNWDTRVRTIEQLGKAKEDGGAMVHSFRSMGSVALALCSVASGTIDLFWDAGCWPWDVCAGWIIVKEAGGLMADANPNNWEPQVDGRSYLAVRGSPNGQGQKELVEEFWKNFRGEFVYS